MGNKCLCGCGEPVNKWYLPGHDAKHISALLIREATLEEAAAELPTSLLYGVYERLSVR